MTRVVVRHDDLDVLGGAESVCMHTLEAIQPDFDVTLITEPNPTSGPRTITSGPT